MNVTSLHWLLFPFALVDLKELLTHETFLLVVLMLKETQDLLLLNLVQVLLHLEDFKLLTDLVDRINVGLYLTIHKYYIIPVFS